MKDRDELILTSNIRSALETKVEQQTQGGHDSDKWQTYSGQDSFVRQHPADVL